MFSNKFYINFKKRILCRYLLLRLRFRCWSEERQIAKEFYPKKWVGMDKLISNDIHGYLNYEGKSQHDVLELTSRLYASLKDIKSQITKLFLIFIVFSIYIISYDFGLNLTFSFTGINLEKKVEILAGVLILCMFIRHHLAVLELNGRVLKIAISSIISNEVDDQLAGTLRSAFLYFDNAAPYRPGNNPELLQDASFLIPNLISTFLAVCFYLFIEVGIVLSYVKAVILIYETSQWNQIVFWSFVVGLTALFMLSVLLMWQSLFPVLYKDWTTNTKIQLIDQLDEQKGFAYKDTVFSKTYRTKWAIERLELFLTK